MTKRYYVTVQFKGTALAIDPNAELVVTLPQANIIASYCCKPSEIMGVLPERYVYRVHTNMPRKDVKNMPGMVRVRAVQLPSYQGQSGVIVKEFC